MFRLALSSLRFRASGFVASFINVFLGATLLMAFAAMYDTGNAPGVPDGDREGLTNMTYVVGGWGILIAAFGVAVTMNLSVRQRATEIALLKSAGATPAQIGLLIIGETAVVTAVASVLAIPAGYLAGRGLLSLLASADRVGAGIDYRFGAAALGLGIGNTFVAAAIATFVTARRAAGLSTKDALTSASTDSRKLGKGRLIAGALFLLSGTNCAVLTATLLADEGFVTEAVAGQACISTSIGFAFLGPLLMRLMAPVLGPVVRAVSGSSGYLAGVNIRQRASQSAGVLMPIILFVGVVAGSLYLQSVQNNASVVQSADEKGVETLNLVIVGMIAVFAAVVLINVTLATTMYRGREFGQQRLIGATPPQVMRMLGFETVVTVVTGLVFGTVAALAGVIPYSIALTGDAVPDIGPGVYLVVIAVLMVVALAANLGSGWRAIRRPALEAVAVNG
ncbi:ABC transporter permease [Phytohabitans kaempferiae]|uniref:FtsX-like permease family protein n=1 Tax=Phytohabitans kaempferiae TaxID=1620943 RepID=A0ABV6MF74_9ACTN